MNRWTRLTAVVAACALALIVSVSVALADAPDSIIAIPGSSVAGSTHGKVVSVAANRDFTVEVWGGSWVGDPAGTTSGANPAGFMRLVRHGLTS